MDIVLNDDRGQIDSARRYRRALEKGIGVPVEP